MRKWAVNCHWSSHGLPGWWNSVQMYTIGIRWDLMAEHHGRDSDVKSPMGMSKSLDDWCCIESLVSFSSVIDQVAFWRNSKLQICAFCVKVLQESCLSKTRAKPGRAARPAGPIKKKGPREFLHKRDQSIKVSAFNMSSPHKVLDPPPLERGPKRHYEFTHQDMDEICKSGTI